jgi:hypothetical protein
MGYAYYEVIRNGEKIEAGYGVEAICEKANCNAKIDRGLAYLCGKTPGGDEHGCGGYFCEQHLYGDSQCASCAKAADEANAWTHPGTGEEFDLRDDFLPAGTRYEARGIVWRYAGAERDGSPVLEPTHPNGERAEGTGRLLTEREWENVGTVMVRQMRETSTV